MCSPAGGEITGPPVAVAAISALRQLWPGSFYLPPPSLLLSWLPHQGQHRTHCLRQCSSSHLNVWTEQSQKAALRFRCRQPERSSPISSTGSAAYSTASRLFPTSPLAHSSCPCSPMPCLHFLWRCHVAQLAQKWHPFCSVTQKH